MVMKLKTISPAKFFGNTLPRPRFYTDVKFNDHRVDPPADVLDPFLSWANEAHWSMGGLSFKRLRLQGRIEGSVGKLRAQREKEKIENEKQKLAKSANGSGRNQPSGKRASSDSPPPAPIVTKRRRFLDVISESDEEEQEAEVVKGKRLVKKLVDEFDKVAMEAERGNSVSPSRGLSGGSEGASTRRTRSRRSEEEEAAGTVLKVAEEVNKLSFKDKKLKGKSSKGKENKEKASGNVNGTRTSPRLAKRS